MSKKKLNVQTNPRARREVSSEFGVIPLKFQQLGTGRI